MNGSHEGFDTPRTDPPVPAGAPDQAAPARAQAEPARQPGGYPQIYGAGRRGASPPRKYPALACVLSALPGVGQVYVGYYKLGFIHNIVFAVTIASLAFGNGPLIPFLGIFLAFFCIYNIVDAGRRAVFYNLALDGVGGLELPRDMNVALPNFGGSIGGGVILIVVGFILLLNTRFGVSLAWVEEWWPVAPMILGAYLVIKAIQERGRDVPATAESDM